MPYGTLSIDRIIPDTTLTITGNVAIAGNLTTTGNITSSRGTVTALVSGTAQNTTTGTNIDFTGIPSWAKRITLMLSGVSTSGTSNWLIQLGTASGIENTGYLGVGSWNGSSGSGSNYTAGFGLLIGSAAHVLHGQIIISQLSSVTNTWTCFGSCGGTGGGAGFIYNTTGAKSLAAALTQLRLTTVNGTDTFDAGTVNIMYE